MPDNHLHGYFRYLVDHPQLLRSNTHFAESKQDQQFENNDNGTGAATGALSLLGSVYGSGEDDEGVFPAIAEGMEPGGDNFVSGKTLPAQDKDDSGSMVLEDKEVTKDIKHSTTVVPKDRVVFKRNQLVRTATISASNRVKAGAAAFHNAIDKLQRSQPSESDLKSVILEPPSFLKRTIEKLVEFIIRNGKEFEGILIEQDKAIGRFPFLLPSNQYHLYYRKILDEAPESKLLGKSSERKHDSQGNGESKRRLQAATSCENGSSEMSKERFKMMISGPKKDSAQQPLPARQCGVSTDEAAAIVLAATRGVSPFNVRQNATKEEAGSIRTFGEDGRASSGGSFSLLQGPNNGGASSSQHSKDSSGMINDVWIAKTIAKTAALVASSEADSSEASLTKEQKLKVERLKRAKMFTAMLKSGGDCITESLNTAGTANELAEASVVGTTRSPGDEREGSSMPFEPVTLHKEEREDYDHNFTKEHKYRKKHREEEELKGIDEPSRKKHRSDQSGNHTKADRKHRKRHSSSKDKEAGHSGKHHSSSEDEHVHRTSTSWHRHRHRDHDEHTDDEIGRKSHRHRREHPSSSRRKQDVDKDDTMASDAADGATTEVPSELRAKIRAMLLETL